MPSVWGITNQKSAAIGSIVPHISWPSPPSWLSKIHVPFTASGGVFDKAQTRIIAEAGAEAVVPLNRPLSQVDPSVRGLSTIAQGLAPAPGLGKSITNHWSIMTPTTDPAAVAAELLNRMVASAI